MVGPAHEHEIPGMEERSPASKTPKTIDKTHFRKLEKALLPYEKRLVFKQNFDNTGTVRGAN